MIQQNSVHIFRADYWDGYMIVVRSVAPIMDGLTIYSSSKSDKTAIIERMRENLEKMKAESIKYYDDLISQCSDPSLFFNNLIER